MSLNLEVAVLDVNKTKLKAEDLLETAEFILKGVKGT